MKKIWIMILLFCSAGASAQQQWSIDDCIAYALKHSVSVQQSRYEAKTSRAEKTAAALSFLPSVSAQVGGQLSWGRNIDPETNTYNDVATFSNGYGLYASLALIDGGRTFNQWREAKVARRRSLNAVEQRKDEKAIEVMQAFVDAAYTGKCVALAGQKLAQSEELLHKTEVLEEVGLKSLPDVAQLKAQKAEDEFQLVHQQNLYATALSALKKAMNMPPEETVELALPDMEGSSAPQVENIADIQSYAAVHNTKAMDARMEVQQKRLELLIRKGALYPSLSFSAGISTSYFKSLNSGVQAIPFHQQFKNNRGEYISLTLSIPLFDNFGRLTEVKRARNNCAIARLQYEDLLQQLNREVQDAVNDEMGFAAEVRMMNRKVEADSLSFHLNRRKYEEGTLSSLDLQTSANALLQSKITLLQKQMLYLLKERLVRYYKGETVWTSN